MHENRPDDGPEVVAAASNDHDLPIQIVYPAAMDDGDWLITEAKGWIEATIRCAGKQKTITFYDPIRLAQEIQSAVDRSGYFAEPCVVVVPAVTKEAIETAVALIAGRDFVDIG